jgi:hypothetical protein
VEYVAHLIRQGRAPNAISAAMSAVRTMQPEDKRPGTRQARGMLNEYRTGWVKRVGVRKAPAITDPMLGAMVGACDLTTPAGHWDRCALLLDRGALNRRIELADLSIADVSVDDDFVTLHILSYKTDQEAEGEHTDIPADPDPLLDPVAAVRDWLTVLHALGAREGAFFRALTSRGTLQNRAAATNRGDYVTGTPSATGSGAVTTRPASRTGRRSPRTAYAAGGVSMSFVKRGVGFGVRRRCRRGACWWLGAISNSGHGKLRAGSRPAGTSRVVSAHVLGAAIQHGAAALESGVIVRHRCDEAGCQNPGHWILGDRLQNLLDFQARRGLTGHPLADVRGAAGRAVAVRDAILAARPGEEAAAIAAALAPGYPAGGRQDALW